MANPEHVSLLNQGVESWNLYRRGNLNFVPDLSHADFHHRDLTNVDFSRADLRETNLFGTILSWANLCGANLTRCNLRESRLSLAQLAGANLSQASLRAANLGGADLTGANLTGARLVAAELRGMKAEDANMTNAIFGWSGLGAGIDLSRTRGLETAIHEGPSSIGIDTVYASKGQIPHAFLRGAGVPESFIAYMTSLAGRPVEMYSCFISYSFADQEFAERLHADLQARGVRCWFAPHHGHGGRKLHEQIDEAIRLHDKLLLILSESSMNSNWVSSEIGRARAREVRERRPVLFPIRLVDYESLREWTCFDADLAQDLARVIREYLIPDFSGWKDHDAYWSAFQRLLRDLTNEDAGTAPAPQ